MKLISGLLITTLVVAACNPSPPIQEVSPDGTVEQTQDSSVDEQESKIDADYRIFAWGGLFKNDSGEDSLEIRTIFRFRRTGTLYYNFMMCKIEGKPALSIDYCGNKAIMERFCEEKEDGEIVARKFEQTFLSQKELIFSEQNLAAKEKEALTKLLQARGEILIPVYLSEISETSNPTQNQENKENKTGIGRKLKKGKGWVTRNF
jgi:hypothetical protein